MKNNFRIFWNDLINGDVIFSIHLKSSTHLLPSRETQEKKTRKPIKLLQMNRGKGGRTEKRKEKVKKETDGNQAVGEFCLDKAGEWTPVTLRKPQISHVWHQGLLGTFSTGAGEQQRALTTAWPEKPVSTQLNEHLQMTVGAMKEHHRRPWVSVTVRCNLNGQVTEDQPELVTFALEKTLEPVEGGWERGGPAELVTCTGTWPLKVTKQKVEAIYFHHCIWAEKSMMSCNLWHSLCPSLSLPGPQGNRSCWQDDCLTLPVSHIWNGVKENCLLHFVIWRMILSFSGVTFHSLFITFYPHEVPLPW